ncbi:hypothetical protein SDRG_07604 [Saprolegnia diclina VS20]|uniref:Uncharacterized protein n=1 Tax=Saprolegnia diclina (strain VS20) TaxID=1156394 RepID=T0QA62_SAPDV|nr:hypothetical protein SDRG_07604 [Saprolegnia diclina VS20]EQC34799.1 hypothetical protein SDRG_07604 [Saprolegnia diclina VS20]|eukprot:XP_008611671.1 hypothetical protein SDRG_07604 [Saprolegnia diclina VS20]
MLRKFAQRCVLPRAQPRMARFLSSAPKEDEASSESTLLDLHFTQEADGVQRPFRFVGVRDVEVEDKRFEDRDESVKPKNAPVVLRNAYGQANFISLYVDALPKVVEYMKQNGIPHEPVTTGADGVDLVTIPPTEESAPHFNLCDKPAFVELVQASADLIAEFDANEKAHTVEN